LRQTILSDIGIPFIRHLIRHPQVIAQPTAESIPHMPQRATDGITWPPMQHAMKDASIIPLQQHAISSITRRRHSGDGTQQSIIALIINLQSSLGMALFISIEGMPQQLPRLHMAIIPIPQHCIPMLWQPEQSSVIIIVEPFSFTSSSWRRD